MKLYWYIIAIAAPAFNVLEVTLDVKTLGDRPTVYKSRVIKAF